MSKVWRILVLRTQKLAFSSNFSSIQFLRTWARQTFEILSYNNKPFIIPDRQGSTGHEIPNYLISPYQKSIWPKVKPEIKTLFSFIHEFIRIQNLLLQALKPQEKEFIWYLSEISVLRSLVTWATTKLPLWTSH